LKIKLHHIAKLQSGLFAQPEPQADTLYLQGVHFNEFGEFNRNVKPQLKSDSVNPKHLLQENDILFAAKGLNNFAVVYHTEIGKAVASSSFIIVRQTDDDNTLPEYLAWYLSTYPGVKLYHKQLGTTVPSISIATLNELDVATPSIEQQRRIVQIQQLRNQEKKLIQQLGVQKNYLIKHTLLTAANQ